MRKVLFFSLIFLTFLFGEKVIIEIDSGFYDRENEIVKVELNFKEGVNVNSFNLKDEEGKKIDFYFIPKDKNSGELYWIVEKMPSLTSKKYFLYYEKGEWSNKVVGKEEIQRIVSERMNLVPNYGFEELEDGKVKDWELKDYAWSFRNLPDIKSFCRVTEEDKYEGKRSLKIASEKRGDKTITGYAFSSIFPLKQKTRYKFSYNFKITKVNLDKLEKYSALSIEVQLLNEKKERIYPTDYTINRIHLPYALDKSSPDAYLNKWLEISTTKETSEEVRYGRINISFWDVEAEVFIDNLSLIETEKKEPIKIKEVKYE